MAGDTKSAADLRRGGIGVQRRNRRPRRKPAPKRNYAPPYKPPTRSQGDTNKGRGVSRANRYKRTPAYKRTVQNAGRLRAPAGRGPIPIVEQGRSRKAQVIANRQRAARKALRNASPAQRRRVYRYVNRKRRQGKTLTPEERVAYRRQQRIAKGKRRQPAASKGVEAVPLIGAGQRAVIAERRAQKRAPVARAAVPVFTPPVLANTRLRAPQGLASTRTTGVARNAVKGGRSLPAAIVGEMAGELSRGVRRAGKIAGLGARSVSSPKSIVAEMAGDIAKGAGKYSPYRKSKGRKAAKGDFQGSLAAGLRGTAAAGGTTPFSGTIGAKAATETGRAFAEQPGSTSVKTATGFRDTIAAIPAGLIAAATDPASVPGRVKEDYERRYGPLASGSSADRKKFRERVKKEGAAPELIDAASIGVAGVGSASRLVSAGVRGVAPGTKAAKFLTKPRPKLRYSGGPEGVKRQSVSKGVIGVARQRATDKARVAAEQRRNAKARKRGRGTEPVQAGPGEVTPLLTRTTKRMQRKETARLKGRALLALREEQAEKLREPRKAIAGLSKAERRAYYYVASGTVPNSPESAIRFLRQRKATILRERAESGKSPSRLQADELREIDWLLKNKSKAFTPKLKEAIQKVRVVQRELESKDPGLTPEIALARRFSQQADVLGLSMRESREMRRLINEDPEKYAKLMGRVKKLYSLADQASGGTRAERKVARQKAQQAAKAAAALIREEKIKVPGESPESFVQRVAERAEAEGLEDPLYFPSRKRWSDRSGYSAFAPGGKRAVADPRRYKGDLFREGRQVTNPEVQIQGLALNVKRRVNWQLVSDTVEKNALNTKPGTVDQVLSELEGRGIDTSKVMLWDPRRYSQLRKDRATVEKLRDTGDAVAGDDLGVEEILDAIRESKIDPTKRESFRQTGGRVFAVPKEVLGELEAQSTPAGAIPRTIEIVKGKQARYMLAFLNLPWMQFQIASNAVMTGFATGGRLTDMAKAQVWWRKLSPEEKKAISPIMGVGTFQGDIRQIKLGGSADNAVVNAWRAFKELPAFQRGLLKGKGPSVSDLNPIDLMFRLDNAQNNFFRRTVLYNQVKRQAYESMGANASDAAKLMDRVTTKIKGYGNLGPQERMRRVLVDRELMEQAAEKVDDFLGDYMTFTARERRTLARYVMFYGFLRFSLKLVFYTLPVKHPVASAILLKLGQLQKDEITRLFGDDQAAWVSGRIFFGDSQDKSIDVSRGNPALNTLLSMRQPGQVFGVLPPVAGVAIESATAQSLYKGRGWRVEGETQPRAKNALYGPEVRGRVALASTLRTLAPYRLAEDALLRGPQGEDSLLWSPRETKYKRKDIVESIERQKAKQLDPGVKSIARELVPFIPKADPTGEIVESKKQQGKKKKKEGNPFKGVVKGGGGSDNPFAGVMGS